MRVSSLLGRNASCCDFKQLFPRLAGVALHGGTGAKKKQAKIIFGTFMQLPPRVGSYVAFIFARWMAALSIQLDRFGRSLKELLETGEDLNGREINLISLKERIDTISAADELVFHVFGAIAQFEHRLISQRTKDGLAIKITLRPESSSCRLQNLSK